MKARSFKFTNGNYAECSPGEATHLKIRMPGPIPERGFIPITITGTRAGTPNWTWNGSLEAPTLRPSLLTRFTKTVDEEIICHSWVTDGQAQFLSDCNHEFASQTLPLLEI